LWPNQTIVASRSQLDILNKEKKEKEKTKKREDQSLASWQTDNWWFKIKKKLFIFVFLKKYFFVLSNGFDTLILKINFKK
jgi:hypothetical protein